MPENAGVCVVIQLMVEIIPFVLMMGEELAFYLVLELIDLGFQFWCSCSDELSSCFSFIFNESDELGG